MAVDRVLAETQLYWLECAGFTVKGVKTMAEETTNVGGEEVPIEETDSFAGCDTIPGHEKLGRVIRDPQGQLSGSPANYEALRGVSSDAMSVPLSADEEAELLAWLEEQVPPEV